MPTKKEPTLSQLLAAQIRATEGLLTKLRAAQVALGDTPTAPVASDVQDRSLRKRKPSTEAVNKGLVTTGGHLVDYGPKVIEAIKAGNTTTKQVSAALFTTGLGMNKKQFHKRIGLAIYRLAMTGEIKGTDLGGGSRAKAWEVTKK